MKKNQIPLLCLFLTSISMSSVHAATNRWLNPSPTIMEEVLYTADKTSQTASQNNHLQPTPQQVVYSEQTIDIPKSYKLTVTEGSCATACNMLNELMPNSGEKSKFTILIGKRGDKSIRKYTKKIPAQKEGYYLEITDNRIVIAGNDNRGAFYAVQTLSQLIRDGKIACATITDYPDIAYRGVVEGFYGTPWSHHARLRQLEFYGRNKMNTYIYGPKDDPYHSSPNWRQPYPEKEAAQLKELVDCAHRNEVDFVWAIHPGKDIKWTTEDRDALIRKFEAMYDLGIRSFAVFFDDIWGEGTNPVKQAELLNYIDNEFIQKKKDVTPLVMCPTEYNKSWSNVEGGYLTTLGDKLNPSIEIMWTGDRVIACIDRPTMDWINPLLKRKAYIWWNFPVSDYVRDHLLLGPVYGNALDIKDEMSGFVSNPMERAEASKIALYSVADYTWQLKTFDSENSWKQAMKDLLPNSWQHLLVFAAHSSDLGPNGHGFRRDESVELQPTLKALASNIADRQAALRIYKECQALEVAADILLTNTENPDLIQEIRPWLQQAKLLGEYGQCVLNMLDYLEQGNKIDYRTLYDRCRSLQTQMYELDMRENQNPYQPGVKVGSKVLLPTLNQVFTAITTQINEKEQAGLDPRADYSPFTLSSDVPQLKTQPVRARHNEVNVSPSNEVIKWPANGQVRVAIDKPYELEYIVFDLGTPNVADKFCCQVSADGINWITLPLIQKDEQTQIQADIKTAGSVKQLRFQSKQNEEIQVYFKKFAFKLKK